MIHHSRWILFSKYFAGECNQAEMEKLNKLIERRESYRKLFARLNEDNEIIDKYKKMKTVDVDKAWNKISQRIQAAGEDKIFPMVTATNHKYNKQKFAWIGVAASILLIAGLIFTFRYVLHSRFDDKGFITVNTPYTDTPILLPDGSKVYLNTESRIKYPEVFSNGQREVFLEGEAFFEVMPDPGKPFLVKAGNARIKVLGTSFSVNDRAGKNMVEVFVETGKVQLYQEEMENETLLIEPGYVGQLARKTQSKFINKNQNIIAWKTRKIIFNKTSLSEVFKVLENVYREEIRCENKDALNWPYTNTFDNQDFQSVLKVLVESNQFKVKQDQNGVVLSGGIN